MRFLEFSLVVRAGRVSSLGLILGVALVSPEIGHAQPASRTNEVPARVVPKPFLQIIRARPSPDIPQLLARCKNSQTTRDALFDILKLRESRDPAAAPVLTQILSEFHPGWTYNDAAAEALYAIGTPEAHAALSELLVTKFAVPKNPAQARPYFTTGGGQFDFASYWEMQEPLRSRFIAQYVLTNVSTDLVVDVIYKSLSNAPFGQLEFQIGFSNTTQKPLILPDFAPLLLRTMLYLRRSDGTYPNRYRAGPDPLDRGNGGASALLPGTRKIYLVQGVLRRASRAFDDWTNWPPFVLEFMNYRYYLTAGDYSVIAMCEAFPRTPSPEERQAGLTGEKKSVDETAGEAGWLGRAVSKPLPLTVAPPGKHYY